MAKVLFGFFVVVHVVSKLYNTDHLPCIHAVDWNNNNSCGSLAIAGHIRGWGMAIGHKSLTLRFKSRLAYILQVFHL